MLRTKYSRNNYYTNVKNITDEFIKISNRKGEEETKVFKNAVKDSKILSKIFIGE